MRAYGLSYSWGLVQVRDMARGGNGGVGGGRAQKFEGTIFNQSKCQCY